jgi:hypothetical protein
MRNWNSGIGARMAPARPSGGCALGIMLLFAAILSLRAAGLESDQSEKSSLASSDDQTQLRFTQPTDLHLFDAESNCYAPDVSIEESESVRALEWAIGKINEENRIRPLDFVVFTGDLGLVNLTLPGQQAPARNKPQRNACSPSTPESVTFGPVDSISISQAAASLAALLRGLSVHSIYLVPGNNDVRDESSMDREAYKTFVAALAYELPGRIRDLTDETNAVPNPPPDKVKKYRLVRMDTASFKPTDAELAAPAPPKGAAASPFPDCEAPDTSPRQAEIKRVTAIASAATERFLIFTHIPDVMDPFPGSQQNKGGTCRLKSSWFLDKASIVQWNSLANNPLLVGVFSGHFHSMNAADYGGPFASATAAKENLVYIAPPLALKNQWQPARPQDSPPKRGLLFVEVEAGKVVGSNANSALRPIWYSGLDPATLVRTEPGQSATHAGLIAKSVAFLMTFILFAAIWSLARGLAQISATANNVASFFSLVDTATNTYSLSKVQFFAWTAVGIFSYVYLAIVHIWLQRQPNMPDIPMSFVQLLGVSVSAAMGGIVANRMGNLKAGGTVGPELSDFISDGGDVAPDRVQFLLWNLVALLGYLMLVLSSDAYTLLTIPDVPTNMLYLTGLSAGGYVLGRFIRQPGVNLQDVTSGNPSSQQAAPTPAPPSPPPPPPAFVQPAAPSQPDDAPDANAPTPVPSAVPSAVQLAAVPPAQPAVVQPGAGATPAAPPAPQEGPLSIALTGTGMTDTPKVFFRAHPDSGWRASTSPVKFVRVDADAELEEAFHGGGQYQILHLKLRSIPDKLRENGGILRIVNADGRFADIDLKKTSK